MSKYLCGNDFAPVNIVSNDLSKFHKTWYDESGFVISIELILVAVLALIGLLTGITSVRDALISELSDLAGSVQDSNQSYVYFGVIGHSATSSGAGFNDQTDHCDTPDDTAGQADNCISFDGGTDGLDPGDTSKDVTYKNADSSTDISASQNGTRMKWELEPGQDANADAVTQAIIDCIKSGNAAVITWVDTAGNTHTFTADTILADGPSGFAFSGTSSGSASGKLQCATISCPDAGDAGGGVKK